jgi:hypothetical protein
VIGRDSILQHVLVKEHQRVKRLILSRGREAPLADEVIEKGLDVRGPQLLRRRPPPALGRGESEKPPNPVAIDLAVVGDMPRRRQPVRGVSWARTNTEHIAPVSSGKRSHLSRPPAPCRMVLSRLLICAAGQVNHSYTA